MKGSVCKVCGYVSINGAAPDNCPVCMAPKTEFEEQDAYKTKSDEPKVGEKHVPVIKVVKKCGLVPEGCVDVHIRVGSTLHPMEEKHYITSIDVYLNSEFIARTHLTPVNVNPSVSMHLKASSGKLSVIERCNLHGAWIADGEL